MPKIRANKRYLSPNSAHDRKIMVQKKLQRRKGNYILEETIGEGAFAKVKLGTHIHTGEKVAIKILNKDKLFEEALEDNLANGIEGCDIQKIRKEINILKRLRHKNVIQLYEIMESKTNLYIVMEYCEGKELFDYIVRNKYLSEKEACRFFQQIIDGVEYLHLSNITHRDLKPENLLLDNKKRIRISDFGLSNMSDKIDSLLETPCGTPSYAPPEMLRGEKYNGVYSDIWSCGIILYTMLVGNLPCAESKEDLIYENIMTHNYYFPENISDDAIDLIENMLKVDPSERYDFEQIKSHPWFNLVEPKLKPGIVYGIHKIPVDENILNKVETFGYDKNKVLKSIENYSYDSNCSIYYLTLKQFTRENKSSISDLFSEKYLKYLKNYKNWIKPEEINNPLFMNYEVEMPFEIEQEKAKNYITNALLAYNEKNYKNKNINIKNIDSIPEEETKNNNKSFDASISIANNNQINLNYPMSTKNKKININKRVFNNEIEKFKKEDEPQLNLTMIKSKEEKLNNIKNNNNYKTEKKININNQNLNSIVANINKNRKLGKKIGTKLENNSSAKKINNNNNNNLYSKIKTPDKKTKIRKNVSYGEISNYEKNKNTINVANIQDIIKKRVRNKKKSMDNCKSNVLKKDKEKNKFIDLSNSKKKIKSNDKIINEIKKENNENKNKNVKDNENNLIINKSTKEYNKEKLDILMEINNEENNKDKIKKKSQNINRPNKNNYNKYTNNNNINKNNVKNNNKSIKNDINDNNKNNNKLTFNPNNQNKNDNKGNIDNKDINDHRDNKEINDKLNLVNETQENKISKEASIFSDISEIEKPEKNNNEQKNINQQQNNENKNNLENENNNKVNQDQMSNIDILSDSSSISKTVLSPKGSSLLSSNGNNIGIKLNLNANNASSYSKRVEYSNTKAKRKGIRPKFKKKIEEEPQLELFTETLSNTEKMKLIQKLENDEEKLNNEINLINNITADTTFSSININNNEEHNENLNMIHLMAKKMLKNSVFGKYLLNNKKPKKPIKEDIEKKFYTLQKYKNIIGMIEHLKNKIFKKKYVDFNYETFDDYLNDEDDKLFNYSLLKTMGINRFIRNAKECLYKREKLNKRSQSKAYGLNAFKFNNVFQTNRRPTRFATTKNVDYYKLNNLNIKRNFGYYKPKKNLSILSSSTNSKSKIKNQRKKLHNYTTTNNESLNSITYNIVPVNKKKKYLSSEKNTEYNKKKNSSVQKKIRINIKTFKYNKKNNNDINSNVLNKIRERITNNSINNRSNVSSTTKNQYKKKIKYNSSHKNRSNEYDSDYDKKNNHQRNTSTISMNNIYESEESISSQFNSSVEKDKNNNINVSVNFESNNKEEETGIYKKNKNITTPELGSKFNHIFTKNDMNKYDNDDDQFITENLPISVNLTNLENITGSCSKRGTNENIAKQKKMRINFNYVNDKKKVKNNYIPSKDKILYNTIFSPKSSNSTKHNIPYLQKNKNIGKKKDIAIKDNEKLNKEIWNMNNKKNKLNTSVSDVNINKIEINSTENDKKNKYNNLNNTQIQLNFDNNESKLNKTTINVSKKNSNSNGLKEFKENIPIDLNSILNLTINEIKSRSKAFFKKNGFFYSEKDNIMKATRGGTIIEMTMLKIGDETNSIYLNNRIKSNDIKKEREIIRKLINSLNKKE